MREGWTYKKLGEVCVIKTGKLNANAMVENGEYPFFTCDSRPYRINQYAFDTEAILISGNGSLVGHVNYYKGKFNAYQRTYVLDNFSYYNIPFLLFFLKRYLRPYIKKHFKGGCIPYITLPILQSFSIPLPPLTTQQQIVSELDLLTHILDQKRQQLKEYDALAESIFYDMFGDPKTSQWSKLPLKDLSISIGDGLHGTPIYDETGTYFFVNGNNLREGSIVIDKQTKRVNQSEFSKYKIEFTERTIFVSINGTIGNKAFYNNEDIILGKSACYIQLKEDINKQYVYFLLGTPYFFEYVGNELTGTTIKNVSLKSMRSMPIPLPPIELQNSFAAKIQSIEHQKQLLKESIKETEMLFQSRMDYWFNG